MKLKNQKETFKKHSSAEINIKTNHAPIVLLKKKKYKSESTLVLYTKIT